MHGLWRLHLATGLPLKENTLLPLAEWQFANLPSIFATMGKVMLQKTGYGVVTLALVLVAARALLRGPGPFGRLALLAAGTFAGYTLFLLLIYVGHFQGSASTGAQSYWRFNTHLGYFAWAAALVGLAQLLRTRDRMGRGAELFRRWGAALPVLALTPVLATARRLALAWGTYCVETADVSSFDDMTDRATEVAFELGFVEAGERIVITAGVPFGTPGGTNVLRIAEIWPDRFRTG